MDEFIRKNLPAPPDVAILQQQWSDAPYRELIQSHMRKLGSSIENSLYGITTALTPVETNVIDGIWKTYSEKANHLVFWQDARAADILADITHLFSDGMESAGSESDSRVAFAAFQYVTLFFAGIAREDKKFRKLTGIRKGFFFT